MSECFPLLDNRIGWAHILQLISFSDYFFTLNLGLKQKRSLPENRFFTMHLFSWPNSSQQNTKQKSITTSEDVTESLDIRKIVWKGAVDLGLKNPLFGTGVETFAYSYYLVRPKEHNLTSEWDYLYNKAHNEYLNYFATTGFIGLVAYFFLLFSFFKNAGMVVFSRSKSITFNKYKSEDETYGLQKALFAAWCTILVTNFFC